MRFNPTLQAKRSSIAILILAALFGAAALVDSEREMKKVYLVEVDTASLNLPERCVICGRPRSEPITTTLIGDEHSIVDFALYNLVKQPSTGKLLEVPVHGSCARSLRNDLLKRAGLYLLALAALIGFFLYLKLSFWIIIGTVLVIFLAYANIELSKPPPVEFGHGGHHYHLMFSDPQYAREVARIHDAKVVEAHYRGGDYSRIR